MRESSNADRETRRPIRRPKNRIGHLLRQWVAWFLKLLRDRRAEAELRALDDRELRDLGLDRGGIAYAARWGREPSQPISWNPASPSARRRG